MKQEILCLPCAKEYRRMFTTDHPYDDEFIDFKFGKLKKECHCDYCAHQLKPGETAIAYSLWKHGQRVSQWQGGYLFEPRQWFESVVQLDAAELGKKRQKG